MNFSLTSRRSFARRQLTTVLLAGILGTGLAAVVPATAQAAVTLPAAPGAGPIDPNTGYPFWYADGTGQKFELCLDRPDTTPGMCLAAPQNPAARPWADTDPTKSNLGDGGEAFWYDADAKILDGTVRARFVAAQEATFGGPTLTPTAGEQIAFGRVRVRLDGVKPNASYTVTDPYGTHTYVADDGGRVFVTQDLGCLDVPCDFTKASKSSLTSYLRWAGAGGAAPAGYVGDPGVTHEIAPGPNGKVFSVTGPGLGGGPGVGTITTDQFAVQGKLWNPTQPMLGLVSTQNTVDFGKVMLGSTATLPAQTVTLTNAGGGQTPLQLQTVAVGGADSTQFTLSHDTCSNTSLAPGATCTVTVSHTPAATVGSAHAQLNIPSLNGKDSQGGQRILLQGRVSDGTGKDARVTGPIDPVSGFPKWYQDETGTRVALCDNQNDPMCVLPGAGGTYDPALPMRFPTNYPGELFWWNAVSKFDTTNTLSNAGVTARLVLGEEATFLNGDAAAGDQIGFGRIRMRIGGLTLGGNYDVVTPYGDYHFVAEDDGKGGGKINYTEDIGCLGTPCNFDRVNQSNVGPFLRQIGAPKGYLGDPAVEAPITGSPIDADHNQFTITGPGLADAGTPLFAVSGKQLAGPTGGKLSLSATTTTVTPAQPAAITLTNIGTAPATPQVSLPANSGFAVVNNGCVDALAPGAFCTVTVGLDGAAPAAPGATATLTVLNGTTPAGTVTVSQPGGVNPAPAAPALTAASDTGISAVDGVTNLTTVTVTGAAASGTPVQVLVDGTPVTTVTAVAGTYSAQLNLIQGVHQLAAAYTGQPASPATRVVVDTTAPTVTAPKIAVRRVSGALLATVTWSGTGAAIYEAQVSRNGGAFTALSLAQADVPRAEHPVRKGDRYRFRVRAIDAAGNISPWATTTVRA